MFKMNMTLSQNSNGMCYMVKRVFMTLLLMLTIFSCVGLANSTSNTQIRFSLKINRPFLLESNGTKAIPAGEYLIRDLGQASQHLFSIERASDHKHLAIINTVRVHNSQSISPFGAKSKVIFDYEQPAGIAVLKQFFPTDADGYELIGMTYVNNPELINVATVNSTHNNSVYNETDKKISQAGIVNVSPVLVDKKENSSAIGQ